MTIDQELTEVKSALAALSEAQHLILAEIRSLKTRPIPSAPRTFYRTAEVATILDKSDYTVRQWCNRGQINVVKSIEKRGGSALWSIASDELDRYRNEGLLPLDPQRNNRN